MVDTLPDELDPLPFVDDYLPALLAQASKLISSEFHEVVQSAGFSVTEWRILATLASKPGLSIGGLADITVSKQPTVTRLLDRMEAKGLVQHRNNPFREMDLKPQHAALQAAESEPVIQNCGWGICMDVDEFVRFVAKDAAPAVEAPAPVLAALSVQETLKPGQSGSAPSLAVLPFTRMAMGIPVQRSGRSST